MRTLARWLVWNVPLGRLTPWMVSLALGGKRFKKTSAGC
jgi:hypothetical protein